MYKLVHKVILCLLFLPFVAIPRTIYSIFSPISTNFTHTRTQRLKMLSFSQANNGYTRKQMCETKQRQLLMFARKSSNLFSPNCVFVSNIFPSCLFICLNNNFVDLHWVLCAYICLFNDLTSLNWCYFSIRN